MGKAESKMLGMGKPLEARNTKTGKSLRGQFTRRFRELTDGKTPNETASLLGISADMVRKYLRGPYVPDLDDLPRFAQKLGLNSWTELFEPAKKK